MHPGEMRNGRVSSRPAFAYINPMNRINFEVRSMLTRDYNEALLPAPGSTVPEPKGGEIVCRFTFQRPSRI